MASPQTASQSTFASLSWSVPAIPVASRDETLIGTRAQPAAQAMLLQGSDQLQKLGIPLRLIRFLRMPSSRAFHEPTRAQESGHSSGVAERGRRRHPASGASDLASVPDLINCEYTQLLPVRTTSRRRSLALSAARVAPSTDEGHGDVIFLPAGTSLRPTGGCQKYTGCQPALGVSASLEAGRRSRLRRILNAILRRRNQAVPAGGKVAQEWPRYDASSLDAADDHSGDVYGDEEGEQQPVAGKGPKRVLILMSDTGGGHRASAEALKATFELEFGNKYQVSIVDAWKEHTPYPFNQLPKSYSFLVKHESLWKIAFYSTKPRFVHQPQMAATSALVARDMAKMLDKHRPDLIVSVHPLMQHAPIRVLRSRGLLHRIPFATVITDLTTCHPTWFHRLVTMCFCPTKEVAQRALRAGLEPPQIRVHGLPIKPAFSQPPSLPLAKLRQELGMDPDLPAVLLIGGGEGMGPVEATARALAVTLKGETRFPGTWESQKAEEALAVLDDVAEKEKTKIAEEQRAALGSVLQHAESMEGEGTALETAPRGNGAPPAVFSITAGNQNSLGEFLTLFRALLEAAVQKAQGPGTGTSNGTSEAVKSMSADSTSSDSREGKGADASESIALKKGGSKALGLSGAGMSRASGSLKQLVRPKGQLVVVCGRNKKLKAALESISWPMPVLVKGFVSNMPDLMAACNCIITKAGPGTIAESLIRGLPMVLNDFIAGQEVGNIPYVVDNGAGVFCDRPSDIAKIVADWFGPKYDELEAMAKRAKEMARPEAVFCIVRDLDSLACGERLPGTDLKDLAYA